MSEVLTKEQQEIAKFAIIAGITKVSQTLSMPEPDVTKWVRLLRLEDLPLIQRIRESILELSQKKSSEVAAKVFGLNEEWVSGMLTDYLASAPEAPDFPCKTSDKSTQTYHCNEADWRHSETQTEIDPNEAPAEPETKLRDVEEKKQTRQYSTADKISAVRAFMKHSSQTAAARELNIPYMSLTRWREKIRNELFQEPHVVSLYSAEKKGRDKFFSDIDEALHTWYVRSKDRYSSADQALLYKARNVAKIEDSEPKVAESWIEAFKKHYSVN
jgi:transposase-like protein